MQNCRNAWRLRFAKASQIITFIRMEHSRGVPGPFSKSEHPHGQLPIRETGAPLGFESEASLDMCPSVAAGVSKKFVGVSK